MAWELLDRDAERELLQCAQAGDTAALETLLARNTGLVAKIAHKYLPVAGRLEYADLEQEGRLGLLHAVRKFDPGRGCRLSTYAVPWIRQAIVRAIETRSRTIRAPVHAQNAAGPEPLSLDYAYQTDDGDELLFGDLAAVPGPEEALVAGIGAQTLVEPLLRILTDRERQVIERRFGLGGGGERTLQQVADELGLSPEGVRHVQNRALARMRRRAA